MNGRRWTLLPPLALVTALAASAEVTVTISEGSGARISPRLLGTQFAFYGGGQINAVRQPESWARVRALGPTVLRYPGGTPAYHLIWRTPADSYAPAWSRKEDRLSTRGFLDICEDLGAEPMMQINTMMLEGVPRGPIRAAHDYANPRDVGQLRQAASNMAEAWARGIAETNGSVPELWQIGNEDWTYYRADEYAQAVPIYADAIRRVKSDARIIAVGLAAERVGPYSLDWLSEDQRRPWWAERVGVVNEGAAWNKALAALPDGTFDLLSLHLYPSGQGDDPVQHYLSLLGRLRSGFEEPLDRARALLLEAGRDVPIAVTEWSADFYTSVEGGVGMDGFYYTQANGVAAADVLGRLVERSPWIDIGVHHSLFTMGTTWLWPESRPPRGTLPLEHPPWKAQALWRRYMRDTLAEATVTGESQLGTPDPVPSLAAWAMRDDAGYSAVVINRDPVTGADVHLELTEPWAADATVSAELLSGSGPSATNWEYDQTGEYPVDIRTAEPDRVGEGRWSIEMPALSVLGVAWSRAHQEE